MELPSSNTSPRRAVSETENRGRPRVLAHVVDRFEDEDPDANQRLKQAISDTVDHHTRVAAAVQERERGVERAGEHQAIILPAPNQAPASGDGAYDRERDREREREADRDRRMVHA